MSKKQIVSKLFSLIPHRRIFKLGFNPIIVNYHSILNADHDEEVNKLTYRTEKEFEEDIIFFNKIGNILNPGDFREHVLNGIPLPPNAILFTVDDGLRISYEILARLFKKHEISAIYFVNSDFIDNKDLHYERKINILINKLHNVSDSQKKDILEVLSENNIEADNFPYCLRSIKYKQKRIIAQLANIVSVNFNELLVKEKPYMSSEQIRQMVKDGFYFGGHSIDHPNFRELNLEEQIHQSVASVEYLKNEFDLKYSFFAFPYDDDFVSKEFFEKVKNDIEITFGTAGLFIDETKHHFQRIDVERSRQSAKKELSFVIGKYEIMKLLSKNKVKRV